MKQRSLALLLAAALLSLLLTACGGSGGDYAYSGGSTAAADGPTADDSSSSYYFDYSFDLESPMEAEPLAEDGSRIQNAKLIYTARLDMETTDFDASAARLEQLAGMAGGYLEYAAVNSYSSGYRRGNYTIRVPSAQFTMFLTNAGEIGQITFQEKDSENISEAYYDVESRLATQRTKLERLQALLAQADNMADLITIESAIAETELAIEQLTGSLRHYDALVDYATITVSLEEVTRLSSVQETPPGFLSRLGSAFAEGLEHFGDWLEGLAILLAYSWLWLVLLVLIVLAAVRLVKRHQQRADRTFGSFRKPPEAESKKTDDNPPSD